MTAPLALPTESAIVLLSGASGVGKTGFNQVLTNELGFEFSVSATTRDLRPQEIDGVHYHKLSEAEFVYHVLEGHFIEWAGVHHGNLYGTFLYPIECAVHRRGRILAEIDVLGRERFIRNAPPDMRDKIFSVFIKSPNPQELERRLRSRNDGVPEHKIMERLARAQFEESRADSYDLVIVNDRFEDLESKKADLRNAINMRFGPWQGAIPASAA